MIMLIAGCRTTPKPPPPRTPQPEPATVPAATPPAELATIIDWMQNGEAGKAAPALRRILRDKPNAGVPKHLLQQIDMDAIELLGETHKEITVSPGDTLSAIAERELGDPLLFYALAKYNGIEVPRLLESGRKIKIPVSAIPPGPAAAESIAAFLLASGDAEPARQMLLQAARRSALSARGQDRLFELTMQRADTAIASGQPQQAVETIDQALAVISQDEQRNQLQQRYNRAQASGLLLRSRTAREAGNLQQAWRLASEATSLDPQFKRAAEMRQRLQSQLVENLHRDALQHWRAQRIDESIELWRQLLQIDPDFTPAAVYLERALRLREKIQSGS